MRWLVFILAACTNTPRPTDTGAACPDPDPMTLGYTPLATPGCTGPDCDFGKRFMDAYCVNCHASKLTISKRNGASFGHDFDSLLGILITNQHIDQQSGFGPNAHNTFMPGAGTGGQCPSRPGGSLDEACPEPTDDERTKLSVWLACEHARPHDLDDAGIVLEGDP